MHRFREIVEAEIENDQLEVNQLCSILGLSRAQLHRKITALTGKSTAAYIKYIRLQKAKTLLNDSTRSVSEIAYAVGFKYPETFSRAFREEFGVPPSQWTKEES